MRVTRVTRFLAALGIAAALGCGSDGTNYFTFLLRDVPIDGQMVDAYFFVPWGAEPVDDAFPCFLVGFDLRGTAVREVAGERESDDVPQPDNTYSQYLGEEDGSLSNNCLPLLDSRFGFGAAVYRVSVQLTRGFPDPGNLDIPPGEAPWGQGTWADDNGLADGTAAFWPYEYGVSGSAIRVYPTAPGGR